MATKWIKRVICMVLACMLMTAAVMPAMASSYTTLAKKGDKYYVTASALNVRTGPSTDYSIKTSIKKGTSVRFQYAKNGWWYVKYSSGKYGFVDKKYLTRSNVKKTGTYKITAKSINVRSGPSTSAHVYGYLFKGNKVKVLQMKGDWSRINYKGHEAWIASKYLKKS